MLEGNQRIIHARLHFLNFPFGPYPPSLLIGLTQHSNKAHICRALLEASAYQTREIIEAMEDDGHTQLTLLSVDGGMTKSRICMQLQADLLGIEIGKWSSIVEYIHFSIFTYLEVAEMKEITALGVAYVSGLAVGFWDSPKELANLHPISIKFKPTLSKDGMFRLSFYSAANAMTFHQLISSR